MRLPGPLDDEVRGAAVLLERTVQEVVDRDGRAPFRWPRIANARTPDCGHLLQRP